MYEDLIWFSKLTSYMYIMERERCVVLLLYEFIGCFLYGPWPRIRSTTLLYWDNASINWCIQLGPNFLIFCFNVTFPTMYNHKLWLPQYSLLWHSSPTLWLWPCIWIIVSYSQTIYRMFLLACMALSWKYMV